jgi:hypothetical protein
MLTAPGTLSNHSIEADAMSKKVSSQPQEATPEAKEATPEAKDAPKAQPSYAPKKHQGFFDDFAKQQQQEAKQDAKQQPTYKMPDHLWSKAGEVCGAGSMQAWCMWTLPVCKLTALASFHCFDEALMRFWNPTQVPTAMYDTT